uniref:uncharacterized protein LOC120334413 n=1 Tax=Styela clava TaxID=7725 RepID=UPI001939B4FD|nr:uncharacterized protein LOC120334413 [Styela clava]
MIYKRLHSKSILLYYWRTQEIENACLSASTSRLNENTGMQKLFRRAMDGTLETTAKNRRKIRSYSKFKNGGATIVNFEGMRNRVAFVQGHKNLLFIQSSPRTKTY